MFERFKELLAEHNRQPIFKRKYKNDDLRAKSFRLISGMAFFLLAATPVVELTIDQSMIIKLLILTVFVLVAQQVGKCVHYLTIARYETKKR